jgi:hypothetical protein
VANNSDGFVTRVRKSDGIPLGTWTGATSAFGVLVADGWIWVTGDTNPGRLYGLNPAWPAGGVVGVSGSLGDTPLGIAHRRQVHMDGEPSERY